MHLCIDGILIYVVDFTLLELFCFIILNSLLKYSFIGLFNYGFIHAFFLFVITQILNFLKNKYIINKINK